MPHPLEPRTMSARAFLIRVGAVSLLVSAVTTLLIYGYLLALLELPSAQWRGFAEIVAVLFVLLFAAVMGVNQRTLGPIAAGLRALEREDAPPDVLADTFRRVAGLPVWMTIAGAFWWTLGGLLVAVAMQLRFEGFSTFSFAVIALSGASGGLVSTIFLFFLVKRLFSDLMRDLGQRIDDPRERQTLMPRVSLRLKLLVSITGVTFVTVIFGMLLAVVQVGRSLETQVNRSQAAFLEEVAPALESGAPEAIALVTARARRLGIGTNVFVADPLLEQVPSGPVQLTPSEGAAIRGGGPSGDSRHVTSSNAFAWRLLSGGARVAVIVQPWEGVSADTRGLVWILATVVCVAAALSLCLSIVLSRDVGRTTDQLKASVDCVATGDLRGLRVIESEDELGALAHSFERMTRALRNTVGGVARAADRVEMAAREIASVCGRVSGGAEEQKEEVERAAASMVRVNDQVSGIAHSSQGLAGLVDDSGQAVLELGAAADELGGTAGVLRARVDEVTGSVEEMVRSVREVGTHTSALSEAASDTTSRMQQMADAMRSADAAAGESVRLSEKAVSVAEAGRDRVRETIDGMRSISESIGRAEVVVRGLGGRAHEIGAILDVIDDVADETSLLALNAAIIAAQAGDHGRGFAVVADEIKELADRVLASTKEIGDLIRAVQTESANAALAISEGARSVAAGMERSEEAGASLSQVTAASHESRTRILEIVESVREQAAASEHVAALMLRVRDGMEVIRRATREQERGNEVVFRSTLGMREVAEQVHATTQEQSRGASGIRHDIDGVRGAADAINAALHSQAASWSEVLRFLEQVSERGAASREEALVLDRETRALHEQAERLRRDIAQFTL